jgi:hypothetical protein
MLKFCSSIKINILAERIAPQATMKLQFCEIKIFVQFLKFLDVYNVYANT